MRDIFDYLNYRKYLNDYYNYRKKESRHFSLRSFGRMVSIDASYLSKILKEQRHISTRSIDLVSNYLKFTGARKRYFKNLIEFNKSSSEESKREIFEKLLSMRSNHTKNLDESQFAYYQKWYYTALRNLLEFYPFYEGDDYGKLGAQLSPPISASSAKNSINLLKTLNLIKKDDSGRYVLTDYSISSGESWNSLAVADFQQETIKLSYESLKRHKKEDRDISTVTMNITEDEFSLISDLIKNLRSNVISVANKVEKPDRVMQLNIQMIPLSNGKKK